MKNEQVMLYIHSWYCHMYFFILLSWWTLYLCWNHNPLSGNVILQVLVYPIYPTPPLGQDMTQGQFLSGV